MKRLLLAGGGQTHSLVLRDLALRKRAELDVVLITPTLRLPYSGMLPGWMAGHYALEEWLIDLAPLARAAGARVILGSVQALDLTNKQATGEHGEVLQFDVLSIATGATIDVDAIAGAREHALALRPLDTFIANWQRTVDHATSDREVFRITVIGGGAGGVECALAAAHRARSLQGAVQIQLITGGVSLLPGHGARARYLATRALRKSGVVLIDAIATEIDAHGIVLADGKYVSSEATLLVTGAAASEWPRRAGLAVDQRGFIEVNAYLQSTSHAFVFAAGDCVALIDSPRPKSGVYAVRAAAPLALNLLAAIKGQPLSRFKPHRRALYLLSTGSKCAIASWGSWAFCARGLWRLKNHIDRGYIAKLRNPTNPKKTTGAMRTLAVLAFIFIIVPLLVFAAGQFGLLMGRSPAESGLREGKLRPPSRTQNSVSSQAAQWPETEHAVAYATIEPFAFTQDSALAMNRLRDVLANWPGARIVENSPEYLNVQFETRWLRFVDDAEFLLDPAARMIHVRSAARLGRKDFGANRARIEAIRKRADLR
ncbi:MAG: FAD-dependent oxidoreductase [Burkholderiaceae bacterium]|nr:FAD-dependent oxidoreductase [Burkholderiaceae bacterium]